jgi:DNA polymerase III epsilon subunit-like protein
VRAQSAKRRRETGMRLLAIDTETTGLDPEVHVPWEFAIVDIETDDRTIRTWRPADDRVFAASDKALDISRFHQRAPKAYDFKAEYDAAAAVVELTSGAVLLGSNPAFDMQMLKAWVRPFGFEPEWHHRPVCVATMAYGWILGREAAGEWNRPLPTLPWSSDELSQACGVDPPSGDVRHTALGDAEWVARWYRRLSS